MACVHTAVRYWDLELDRGEREDIGVNTYIMWSAEILDESNYMYMYVIQIYMCIHPMYMCM